MSNSNYFQPTEFASILATGHRFDPLPLDVVNKIHMNHYVELNPIRERLGAPIWVLSGYRSEDYEKNKGRSGDSHHCFGSKSLGAVDIQVVIQDSQARSGRWMAYLAQLLFESSYTRIAYYPRVTVKSPGEDNTEIDEGTTKKKQKKFPFFHVDYAADKQQLLVVPDNDFAWNNYHIDDRDTFLEMIKQRKLKPPKKGS